MNVLKVVNMGKFSFSFEFDWQRIAFPEWVTSQAPGIKLKPKMSPIQGKGEYLFRNLLTCKEKGKPRKYASHCDTLYRDLPCWESIRKRKKSQSYEILSGTQIVLLALKNSRNLRLNYI
jgi:hypothetical protein